MVSTSTLLLCMGHGSIAYLPASPHAQDCRAESRRRLGAACACEEATCSVCDLLHSGSRNFSSGNKLNRLQAASQGQLHTFIRGRSCTAGQQWL